MAIYHWLNYARSIIAPATKRVIKIPLYLLLLCTLAITSLLFSECYLTYFIFSFLSENNGLSKTISALCTAGLLLAESLILLVYMRYLIKDLTLESLIEEHSSVRKIISAFVAGFQGKSK